MKMCNNVNFFVLLLMESQKSYAATEKLVLVLRLQAGN